MKRKFESDEDLDKEFNSGDVDEFRDQILEQELSSKSRNDESGGGSHDCARVIKLKGSLQKLALPPDWIAIYHKSGGIIYLHRKTRVCTWARPYHIGQASVRKHDVPAVAIPCFHQIMALKKSKKIQSSDSHDDNNIGQPAGNRDDGNHGNHFGIQSNLDGQQGNTGSYHGNSDCTGCQKDGSHSNPDNKSINGENVSKDQDSSTICPTEEIENCGPGNSTSNCFKFEALNEVPQVKKICSGESCVNDPKLETNLENSIPQSSTCQSFNLSNANRVSFNPETSCPVNSNPESSNPETSVPENSNPLSSNSESSNPDNASPESSNPENSNPISSNPEISNHPIAVRNQTISCLKAGESCDSDSSDSGSVSASENWNDRLEMLGSEEIANYLGKIWEFQEITRDEERRLLVNDSNEPPCGTKKYKSTEILKTIPYLVQGINPNSKNKEKVVINPAGKSFWSLLHEYCLKILKVKPEYTTRESGSPKTPFLATVVVDGLQYGSGMAASKKQAKHLAAQRTLEIFLPESFKKLRNVEEHLKIFDTIPVEDPNVYELTSKLGLLSPYQVLNECIKRNQGVLTSELKFELRHDTTNRDLHYSIECGKHKATGKCRSKKAGRELGAQALLQKLHPHLKFWGSVLRIYVDEHTSQEFTKPESPAPVTSSTVNTGLLNDLKHEMWKLMKKKKTNTSTSLIAKNFTDIDI